MAFRQELPKNIQFVLRRGNQIHYESGYPILDSSDSDKPQPANGGKQKFTYRTFGQRAKTNRENWKITRFKGRWKISVQSHSSNIADFKVNKREQIAQFARGLDGEPQNYDIATPDGFERGRNKHGGPTCNDLVGFVYTYLGLNIDTRAKRPGGKRGRTYTASVREYLEQMNSGVNDFKPGSILFYHRLGNPNGWTHNGIHVGGNPRQIINQNLVFHGEFIRKHDADDSRFQSVENYDPDPVFRSTNHWC